jgi:hypothetical protein
VTRGEKIEKLEALLARVRMRFVREPAERVVEANGGGPDATLSVDVDTSEIRPEIAAVERTEPTPPSGEHDSRERLVAAEAVAHPRAPAVQSVPPIDVTEVEVDLAGAVGDASADGEDDEPPISSRRTVGSQAEEQLADMAFGAEEPQPPLHTPPPESGRLPASAAADFEPESDFRGPRDATPMLPRRSGESPPREMSPQSTKPQRVPNEAVAEVIAEAQRFVPSTFVALLDASLGL